MPYDSNSGGHHAGPAYPFPAALLAVPRPRRRRYGDPRVETGSERGDGLVRGAAQHPVREFSKPAFHQVQPRDRCTTAKAGRVIALHPHHRLLAAARRQAATDDFADTYRQHRPMIERTLAWLVKNNHRRLRYRGTERNQLGWSHRCAAVNLKRLLALGLTHNNGWTITTPA